jgi:23S rRNA pseudouridine1911/1915/1917 synthase
MDRILRTWRGPGAEWLSRQAWDRLLEESRIQVNGRVVKKPGAIVGAGDRLNVSFPAPLAGILPAATPARRITGNSEFAVFDKEVSRSSYPLLPWETETFANQVVTFLGGATATESFSRLATPPLLEGGLVQRLDRDTSGLILVALTPEAKTNLRAAFLAGRVEKEYLAILSNPLAPGNKTVFLRAQGKAVKATLEPREGWERVELSLEILSQSERNALGKIRCSQGQRHVVRASLAALGSPLVGDSQYGGSPQAMHHQLHASRLKLLESRGVSPAEFFTPPPQSFLDCLGALGLSLSG